MEAVTIPMATWLGGALGGGAIAAGVATVVSYAVVGATIGAIGSAVMGGNIGKGALYGAIGGSVLGGFNVAFSSDVFAAIKTGSETMAQSGFSAGLQSANASFNAAQGGLEMGRLSTGAVSQHDIGRIAGGIGSTAKGAGIGLLGGTSDMIGAGFVSSAVKGYMDKMSNDDALKAKRETDEQQRQWQAQQNALNRETELKRAQIAASGSGSAIDAAKLNNEGAMARQLAAQEFQRGERKAVRGELLEDRKSFSDSVVSASKQFEAKTAQVSSFLNTPAWLQPKPIVPAARQPTQQPKTQAPEVAQILPTPATVGA